MAIGMSIVFLFLLLLVGVLTLMSRLIIRYAPAPAPLVAGGEPLPSGGGGDERDEELVAVISAAVAKYRAAHRSP